MITAYTGNFASGKTMGAVENAHKHSREGLVVYSNVAVKFFHHSLSGNMLKELMDKHQRIRRVVFLIDDISLFEAEKESLEEADKIIQWLIFNTRGKENTHLIYTTQTIDDIDELLRQETNNIVNCENKRMVKS